MPLAMTGPDADGEPGGAGSRPSRYARARHAVLEALGGAAPGHRPGGPVESFLLALIFLNVLALIFETLPGLGPGTRRFLRGFEVFSVLVFSAEYLLRLWSCTAAAEYRHPLWGRLRYALTPVAMVDLLAVLPFYLPAAGLDLRVVRALRLMRVFRVLKLGRYTSALATLARVLRSRKEELVGTLMILLLLLVIASSLMYFAEHAAQPDSFSSIPAAMWWGIITITTIGYGDMYPVTTPGKLLGAVIALLGIGMFALPTSILGAAFLDELQRRQKKPAPHVCPHCGKPIEEDGEA